MNKIDKIYCMSHYVAFRFIKNENINFFEGLKHKTFCKGYFKKNM